MSDADDATAGTGSDGTAVVWFRRDLRVRDQPTFLAAADGAARGLALFVLDPALLEPSGAARRTMLFRCLRALDESLGGRLLVVRGAPADVVPQVAAAVEAAQVHVGADFGPYGRARDEAVEKALAEQGRALVRTGSPYAVAPGRVTKPDGTPYRVFSPFRRAWEQHGWRRPAATGAGTVAWLDPAEKHGGPRRVPIPDEDSPDDDRVEADLPPAGEEAALARWQKFLDDGVTGYQRTRDRPDRPGTSRMSVHLKYGTVHPRTLLADLTGRSGEGAEALRSELAWREFYADVLWHRPDSARENFDRRFDALPWDSGPAADAAFAAWAEGRTGFPIVDAGMRQLREQAWVHNRVRMIVASFLVKDLHVHWLRGARHFMRYLADGDLASNNHGWQWVAGTGTDAAPFFRVFNPVAQGERFDPHGDYVRRFVPELRDVRGAAVHRPWELPDGPPNGYPRPIVDHAEERRAALERYEQVRGLPG
jgi:deoxyribodipyrimidine photo-lyase